MYSQNCNNDCNATAALSPPYIDATDNTVVLTISQAIMTGGTSSKKQQLYGVMGLDVKIDYLQLLLTNTISQCAVMYTNKECILLDMAGIVEVIFNGIHGHLSKLLNQ